MTLKRTIILSAAALLAASTVSAQQLGFDDVVRNLRNPDPKTRLNAVRLLRDAKYPEAVAPMAPLVLDPIDDIQLETIAAELSFFLEQDVKSKKMVGFVVEKRTSAIAAAAFDLGPLAVWPRPVPAELVTALLQAVDDENAKVRLEAIYATGVIARAPLAADQVAAADQGAGSLRPGHPRRGGARDRSAEGDRGRGGADQGGQRFPGRGALCRDARARRASASRAPSRRSPSSSRTTRKGEGAWSALDALAQIGAPASVPLFKERLQDKDPYIRRAATEGLGRAGDMASIEASNERRDRRVRDGPARDRVRAAEARAQLRGAPRRPDELAQGASRRGRNIWSSSARR